MKETSKDGQASIPRSSTPSLNKMVASMGWGNKETKEERPGSRLSLMSRNTSEVSLDGVLFGGNATEDEDEENMAVELHKPRGVHTLDFMNAVNTHTQVLENSLRELRYDITANPLRATVDIGTEAVILSGLKDRCARSMENIQKLYQEAKFLKSYLEKMEAKAYYDLETIDKNAKGPSWFRRIGFLLSLAALGGFVYRELYPHDFNVKFQMFLPYVNRFVEFLVANGQLRNMKGPVVHRLVQE